MYVVHSTSKLNTTYKTYAMVSVWMQLLRIKIQVVLGMFI